MPTAGGVAPNSAATVRSTSSPRVGFTRYLKATLTSQRWAARSLTPACRATSRTLASGAPATS